MHGSFSSQAYEGNQVLSWSKPKSDVFFLSRAEPHYMTSPPEFNEGADELRLSNGTGPCSGRVEVKHNETWGTVCDGDWSIEDAEVVCKQMQCGSAVQALNRAPFGEGSGPTWLYRVDCRGDERALWSCPHAGWGAFTCPHYFDTGVTCAGFSGLRLAAGQTACSGRLEVQHQQSWAAVCFSHVDFQTASVICQELECGQAVDVLRGAHLGDSHELTWQEEFRCVGNETRLAHCPRTLRRGHACSHGATVVCSGEAGLMDVRLANGSNACSGRVELLHGGTWGTLCDYLWDLPAANALCQQLDCGVALLVPGGQSFGQGNGSVWNGTFSCRDGSQPRGCPVSVLGQDECPAGNDARVVCSGCPGGRLVGGTTCSGRVEIRHGDTWGRLCRSQWTLQAANVLCRQLNCGYARSIQTGEHFVEGNGPVWRDAFHCEGTESCLWDCAQVTLGNPNCSEAATVICSGLAEPLRLSGGESRCEGRVEISLHGVWSRVLDDDWDIKDAQVVCRQLQCGIAQKAYSLPKSERGVGLVGLRSVQCAGNETELMLCKTSRSQTAPMGVAEDVGVICS
ncbi:PREDICTED: scavenger receptor cysteine-rich type 1 protein M130-like, partial [Merops nubicus]|uniref:scavenger receptor cysteine-rich type 1 protein M130-like n=1 Tax=Merops nubicus TaxID=57421 RepID=UPI0004F03645